MEPTTKLNEAVNNPRSRRALLAGVVGGVGAWLVSAAQRAMPAEASAGDPVLAGRSNSGGGFSTELRANTTKPTFRAGQLGGGHALRGDATTGRGVMGTAGHDGTGVWGYSPDHYGVSGTSDFGAGVFGWARGPGSIALEGYGLGAIALKTRGPSEFDGDVLFMSTASAASELDVRAYASFAEIESAGFPGGNRVRLFARDNGSGKTQLCAQFATGDVQVLATQP
jgi:hypothetical protein